MFIRDVDGFPRVDCSCRLKAGKTKRSPTIGQERERKRDSTGRVTRRDVITVTLLSHPRDPLDIAPIVFCPPDEKAYGLSPRILDSHHSAVITLVDRIHGNSPRCLWQRSPKFGNTRHVSPAYRTFDRLSLRRSFNCLLWVPIIWCTGRLIKDRTMENDETVRDTHCVTDLFSVARDAWHWPVNVLINTTSHDVD